MTPLYNSWQAMQKYLEITQTLFETVSLSSKWFNLINTVNSHVATENTLGINMKTALNEFAVNDLLITSNGSNDYGLFHIVKSEKI